MNMSSFTSDTHAFPQELLVMIMSHCEVKDIISLRQCSKLLHQVSHEKLVWAAILTRLALEWEVSLPQFHISHPDTTSAYLETLAASRFRFFNRLNLACSNRISPNATAKFRTPTGKPWRSIGMSTGGQWIAGIYETTLVIYEIPVHSTAGHGVRIITPLLLVEETCNFRPDTEVVICWDFLSEEGSILEVHESGSPLPSRTNRHWVFKVHVDNSSVGSSIRLEPWGMRTTLDNSYNIPHGHSHPPLCVATSHPQHLLWTPSPDGVSVTLQTTDTLHQIIHYDGPGSILCTVASNTTLDVWSIPEDIGSKSGASVLLQQIDSFNWSSEFDFDSETERIVSLRCSMASCMPANGLAHSPDGKIVIRFCLIAKLRKRDQPRGPVRMQLFHKSLKVERRDDLSMHCSLVDVGNSEIPDKGILPFGDRPPFVTMNNMWFMYTWNFHERESNRRLGGRWNMNAFAGIDGGEVRGAELDFGNVEMQRFHPSATDFSPFVGRGANFSGKWMYIFDWGVARNS
ncbi:hypothetical protein DL96DRAFT_1820782 [Flagelloscypha sp. PMI_526]|nr:hypothetical protein DL96DRAFT_1820782 [Flagelloscypha sp. PMI_526]